MMTDYEVRGKSGKNENRWVFVCLFTTRDIFVLKPQSNRSYFRVNEEFISKKYHGLCFMFIVILAVLHHDYDQTFFLLQLSESGRGERGYWIWWSDYGNVIDDDSFLSSSFLYSTIYSVRHLWTQKKDVDLLRSEWSGAAKPMFLLRVILFICQRLMSVTCVAWGQHVPTIHRWCLVVKRRIKRKEKLASDFRLIKAKYWAFSFQ